MRLWYLIAAAILVAGCSSGTARTRDASDIASNAEPDFSVPTQLDRSAPEPGDARQVALEYVASTDTLMAHSPIGRVEIFRSLLTPSAVGEQVAAFEEAAEQLALTLDVPVERLVWVEAPITATLTGGGDSEAAVDVWTVSILGAPDSGSPQQVWRTVHVDLERLDGRWLVASATAEAGPTPASNELALQSGWDDFVRVAGWDPVVVGVGL